MGIMETMAECRRKFCAFKRSAWLRLLTFLCVLSCGFNERPCESPQYLELGTTGVISCSFPDNYQVISWFESSRYWDHPLIELRDGEREGRGYLSGEYDILPNGSLVIKNVSVEHKHIFSVVRIDNPDDEITPHLIEVVPVTPAYPEVDGCDPRWSCILDAEEYDSLTCTIRGVPKDVRLVFRPLSSGIKFMDSTTIIHQTGSYFNVSFSTKYETSYAVSRMVVIECGVIGTKAELFSDTAVLFLNVTVESDNTTVKQDCDCPPEFDNTTVKQDCDCPPEFDDLWWHHPVFLSFVFCCCLLIPSILFVVFPSAGKETHNFILKVMKYRNSWKIFYSHTPCHPQELTSTIPDPPTREPSKKVKNSSENPVVANSGALVQNHLPESHQRKLSSISASKMNNSENPVVANAGSVADVEDV